jgi:hypothetical protein
MLPLLLGIESEEGWQVLSVTENHLEELWNKIKNYFSLPFNTKV